VIWVPIAAWGAAVVLAGVLLGFCAYEISWKAGRLRRDAVRLRTDLDALTDLQAEIAAARERAAAGLR
jgi:hypothetical protein